MKKLYFLLTSITILSLFASPTFAATTQPTSSPTGVSMSGKLDEQINQLKEKIASRVSELNLVEKRGIVGTVYEVKGNQITLTDRDDNTRYADVDEITKFSSSNTKNFGLSDLTKGTKITILGIYNKQSKRILARFINTYTNPVFYSGTVTSTDTKNFQLTLQTSDHKDVKVDVDTSTKVSSYKVEDGLARFGFSKINIGDRIRVVGDQSKKDPTLFSATRIIDYLSVTKDPNTPVSTIVPSPSQAQPSLAPTAPGKKNIKPIQ